MEYKVDPITFEVLSHRFWQITEEGKYALIEISASPIVVDVHDCFAALFMADGTPVEGLVANDSVFSVLKMCGEDPGVFEGDMFLVSDPWLGPRHQSDITLVAPVHHGGKIIAWAGSMAHHLDIGAITPGGFNPGAREVYHEGLRMPPVKLVERGKLRTDLFKFILNMVRSPEKCALDYKGQIACNNVLKRRFGEICTHYGVETVEAVMQEIVARTERRMRERLLLFPDGIYKHVIYTDHDGVRTRLLKWVLTMTKDGDELIFDFTGTDPQVEGPINSPLPSTRYGIQRSLQQILCVGGDYIDANYGMLKPVTIIAPEGTLVNAKPPAPCSFASTSVVQDLSQICIAKMIACNEKYWTNAMGTWAGGPVIKVMFSANNQYNERITYTIMDNISTGCGAVAIRDGVESGGDPMEDIGMPNIETHEATNPILYIFRRELQDSAGPGIFRSGVGMEVMFIPYCTDELRASLLSYGMETPTVYGIGGGMPGAFNAACILRDSNIRELFAKGRIPGSIMDAEGRMEILPQAMQTIHVASDDLFYFRWLGGGGYGDPLDRDPDAVARDVRKGYVSLQNAREMYGVAVAGGGLKPDLGETMELRHKIKERRLGAAHKKPFPSWEAWKELRGKNSQSQRLGEYLEISEMSGKKIVRCRKCNHVFCQADGNPKETAVLHKSSLIKLPYLIPEWKANASMEIIGRLTLLQFACPGCGTAFAIDVATEGDPIMPDVQLKA